MKIFSSVIRTGEWRSGQSPVKCAVQYLFPANTADNKTVANHFIKKLFYCRARQEGRFHIATQTRAGTLSALCCRKAGSAKTDITRPPSVYQYSIDTVFCQ